jgi:hypothetical protein
MKQPSLTPYEVQQAARIADWKGRRPGLVKRSLATLKAPLDRLFEKTVPAADARRMLTRLHRAADWQHGHDAIAERLGIENFSVLRDGPLERCDSLVKKVKDLGRRVITSESLLANAGGIATELLELPAELMLALRAVHRVAACYGYQLTAPQDDTLVLAMIGISLLDSPEERLRARRLIRELEEGKCRPGDEEQLTEIAQSRIEDELGEELADQIGSTLVEEKFGEAIPLLGAVVGVVLDNAFISGVEEAAQRVFQERWLREHGKLDEVAPVESASLTTDSLSSGINQAIYSTSYAISFGVVFPAAFLASAGAEFLPATVTSGMRDGYAAATRDVSRLLRGSIERGRADASSR